MTTLEFFDDPEAFLVAAGGHLEADPLLGTVVASVTTSICAEAARGVLRDLPFTRWWVVAHADGVAGEGSGPLGGGGPIGEGSGLVGEASSLTSTGIAGVGMRTAPFVPYPLYLQPMPDDAAVELGRRLVERGEMTADGVWGVNGALPAVRLCADEIARLTGGTVREQVHTRLFEYRPGTVAEDGGDGVGGKPATGGLVGAEAGRGGVVGGELGGAASGSSGAVEGDGAWMVPGARRLAGADDVPLVIAWLAAFGAAADAQAGRRPGEGMAHDVDLTEEQVLGRIEQSRVWLWEDPVGTPVHLTQATPPSFGVVRIGPVYTPDEHRGRGYATAMVAALSRELAAAGVRVCLFTDQANPTSNAIYQRIGYVPVIDMVNLLVEPR